MNDNPLNDPAERARIAWVVIEMLLEYFELEFATRDGSCIDDVLVLQPASDEFEIH